MKKILSFAIAAALVAPAAAMADSTIYGKVRVASDKWSQDADVDAWGMQDQASRLGIKGSEDLGNGLKAIYQMEFGVAAGSSFNWSGRNSFVGLAGGFGTAVAGRHDTPLKMSTGKLDLFADTAADYDQGGNHTNLFMDRRVDGAIAYISPSFSGFTVAGAVVQTLATEDFQDAYSIAGMYSNGPFYGAVAYEQLDEDNFGAPAENETQFRIGGGVLGWNNISVTGVYETRSDIGGTANNDKATYQLSGAYDMGMHRIKGMYGSADFDNAAGIDFDTYAVGYQFSFSKRTDAQVLYNARDIDDAAGAPSTDSSVLSLQLSHNF
ncbi:MAG: porin [endosymbiont of Seepiophila jonesi]|uniref:Porin n=1 Tax=endosymbiont of Lamellibrachia luymesi TaxID=2200907 RepID=A0A370DUV2_9GAMM|nr:MAG: porin [endosymbiont of Lamellibrachia luymesi]RDH91905.1 MAG: porin [endosymbiont of Seepiophila jonesi]